MFRQHKALVTGADGLLAQALMREGHMRGHSIIPLTKYQLDITSEEQVSTALSYYQPSCVINAAAFSNVDRAEEDEMAYEINVRGPRNLGTVCQNMEVPLVHFSSVHVLRGQEGVPMEEHAEAFPANVYGQSKYDGESNSGGMFILSSLQAWMVAWCRRKGFYRYVSGVV